LGAVFFLLSSLPLATAEVTFSGGEATVAPGESDVSVPLEILAGERAIIAWSAVVRYDPTVVSITAVEVERDPDLFIEIDQNEFVDPGTLGVSVIYNLFENREGRDLLPAQQYVVARLGLCVVPSARAGTHEIGFVPVAQRTEGTSWRTEYTIIDSDNTVRTRDPEMRSATVTVRGDPVPGSCSAEDHQPVPAPEVGYSLAAPELVQRGSDVALDFNVSTNVALTAVSAAMDFDPDFFVGERVEVNQEWFGPASLQLISIGESDVGLATITDLFEERQLLPGASQRLATLHFSLKENAPLGTTSLGFIPLIVREPESVDSTRVFFQNVAMARSPVDPLTDPVRVEVVALAGLALAVRAGEFSRGDANGDGGVDISDPVAVLRYLFAGGQPPACLDAADADDSGTVDVTDPVYVLRFLFRGGPAMPPPYPDPGEDASPDDLDCERQVSP
jgi:hypothetical protein